METTCKAAKAARPTEGANPKTTIKRVFFRGLNVVHSADGEIVLEIPVIPIERPHYCFISDEVRQWTQDTGVAEYDYSRAYEAAQDAFYDTLEDAQVVSYLMEHQVK